MPPLEPPPWEDQARFGWIQAYQLTVRLMFTRPTETFRRMPRQGALGMVVLYVIITGLLVQLFALVWSALFSPLSTLGSLGSEQALIGRLTSTAWLAVELALTPVLAPVALFVSAAITHVCLMIVGGAREGFETTLRGLAYASTPRLLSAVPICGGFVGGIWSLVVFVIALREMHQTGTGRAVLAVVLPLMLCCGAFVAGVMMLGGLAAVNESFRHALEH